MQKMVQSLSCGNQKFKMLKLNLFKQVSRAMGAQFDDYHSQSVSVKVEQVLRFLFSLYGFLHSDLKGGLGGCLGARRGICAWSMP